MSAQGYDATDYLATKMAEYRSTTEAIKAADIHHPPWHIEIDDMWTNHIASRFTWSRFAPLLVRRTPDDQWEMIDGRHRAAAARRVHGDQVELIAYVFHEMPTSEAARLWQAVSGIDPINGESEEQLEAQIQLEEDLERLDDLWGHDE